jgi:nucleoside-diphosphate-sugar epimerase
VKIAIFGATGHVGRALAHSLAPRGHELILLGRDFDRTTRVAASLPPATYARARPLADAIDEDTDLAVNCIGAGDPLHIRELGDRIIRVTEEADELVLPFVRRRPSRRYVFLSSGAVHNVLPAPAGAGAPAFAKGESSYRRAKREAEERHRADSQAAIADLRLFGFASRFVDPSGRYFLSEILAALHTGGELGTTSEDMVRDYASPDDLADLILAWAANPRNAALDVYTIAPVAKSVLLAACAAKFGLQVRIAPAIESPAKRKDAYYSLDRSAAAFGYLPRRTAAENAVAALQGALER